GLAGGRPDLAQPAARAERGATPAGGRPGPAAGADARGRRAQALPGLDAPADRRPHRPHRARRRVAAPPRTGGAEARARVGQALSRAPMGCQAGQSNTWPCRRNPMPTPNDATESFPDRDRIIVAYLQAVEAGEVPNRQDLLDRHPELAESLRAFFADFDR